MKKLPGWFTVTACALAPVLSGLSVYQAVTSFLPLFPAVILYGIAFICLVIFWIRMPKDTVIICRKLIDSLRQRFRGKEEIHHG